MTAKYKDKEGRFRTESLFEEMTRNSEERRALYPPVFTLKEHDIEKDGKTYKSLLNIYLETKDPTEYRFANEVFGSYEHWKKLCSLTWFNKIVEVWRETLEVKLRCEGIQKMMENTDYLKAAQWMAEGNWKDKKGTKQRNKNRVQEQISQQLRDTIDDDATRLGITNETD